MDTLLTAAKALHPELIAHRRWFHQHPELGLDMPLGYAYVWKQLTDMGYSPRPIGKSSLVAELGQGGKRFLLRADMDALPIQEDTGLPFASPVPGCMHACGHDFHAAMLLGAARLLKEREAALKGTVRLFFQAGEEILDGAREAVDCGLLEDGVDGAMMIHILSASPIPDGTICFPAAGNCYASADWFRIDVTGKGGHGAMPQNTISAINTACAINAGLQDILAVVVPPSANACLTVGEFHAGEPGSNNVIPSGAYLAGTIRTFDETVRNTIKEAMEAMVTHTAQARGAAARVTYSHTTPVVTQDGSLKQFALSRLGVLLGQSAVLDLDNVMGGAYSHITGSEDFAYIAQRVPSAVALLSAGTPAQGYTAPAHNPKSDFSEETLPVGAAAYATVAMDWLAENS